MMSNISSSDSQPETGEARSDVPLVSPFLIAAIAKQKTYSKNADAAQKRFRKLRLWILILGLLATTLAILHTDLANFTTPENDGGLDSLFVLLDTYLFKGKASTHIGNSPYNSVLNPILLSIDFFLLLIPITAGALIAGAIKFDRGNNWLLLRGSSESLKREIYYYRTHTRHYKENRDVELAQRMKIITERLKGSPVHQAALNPSEDEIEREVYQNANSSLSKDILSQCEDLVPDRYIAIRLDDQFNRYRKNSRKLDRELQTFQWGIYLISAMGSLLVAVGAEAWVAVTGALIATFSSLLEMGRIESTLVGYNQAADSLYDTKLWWNSLTVNDRNKPENIELLVKTTEGILQSEHDSWLQDMQDKLADLYRQSDRNSQLNQKSDQKSNQQSEQSNGKPEGKSENISSVDQSADKSADSSASEFAAASTTEH